MTKISSRDANILIFIFAGSALIYEMVLASTLVFLFGDSIFYFSLTIAFFILFMGLGSSASVWFRKNSLSWLVVAEVLVTVLGGLCGLIILWVAGHTKDGYMVSCVALVLTFVIGFGVGLEIPILFEQIETQTEPRFGKFLMFDYLGALVGAILFSLFLFPKMDAIGSALAVGIFNLITIFVFVFRYSRGFAVPMAYKVIVLSLFFIEVGVLSRRHSIQADIDSQIFQVSARTQVLNSFRTRYQKVMISLTPAEDVDAIHRKKVVATSGVVAETPWISIYLNNYTQSFAPLGSLTDFYHHAFVHPAMLLSEHRGRVLILGGGDGLPGKEVNKYSDVETVVTVDLDGEWVDFAKSDPRMRTHNFDSLMDPRTEIIIDDAFHWVRMTKQKFDVIFVDFPEGIDFPLARSYSLQFLKDLKRLLNDGGVISFQTDSFNNPVYWSVVKTILAAGFSIIPHRSLEFGDESYGFILASKEKKSLENFESKADAYPFINSRMLFPPYLMGQMSVDAFVKSKTEGLMINTFFHPTFLYYYRTSQPWDIFIGNN